MDRITVLKEGNIVSGLSSITSVLILSTLVSEQIIQFQKFCRNEYALFVKRWGNEDIFYEVYDFLR